MPSSAEKTAVNRPESIRRGVSLSILMSLAAKGLGFALQLAVVYYFGAGGSTDVYFWCLTLILSLVGLVGSLNSSVIVPHGVHLLNTVGPSGLRGFLGRIMGLYLAAGLAVTAILVLFPLQAAGALSRFDPSILAANAGIIRLTLLSLPLMVMTALLTDIFAIHKVFSATIATEALKGAVVVAVFLALRPSLGPVSMALAFLAGGIAQLAVLGAMMKSRLGWPMRAAGEGLSRKLKTDIGFTLMGQSSAVLFSMSTAYLISGFQVGVYSAMNCALSLVGLIQLIFLTKICYVVGVYFMDLYSQERKAELNALFLNYLKPVLLMLFLLLPLAWFFSDGLVSLAFRRGAFHQGDVHVTAGFFRVFILSLPLILIDGFVTQLIFAAKKIGSSFYLQLLFNFSSIFAIWILVARLGYLGYPLGLLAVRLLYLAVLWAYIGKVFTFLDFNSVLRYLAGNTVTILAATACIWPLRSAHAWLFACLLPFALALGAGAWRENRSILFRLAALARSRLAHG